MSSLISNGIQQRDYDRVFDENPDFNFFYNAPGYGSLKLVVGRISLKNAIERLKKGEVYTVVKYHEGEELPEQYMPLENIDVSDENVLLATIKPNLDVNDLCANGGCQMITMLNGGRYLLGAGPDKVTLSELIDSQLGDYKKEGHTK